jgi:hypothetical protein
MKTNKINLIKYKIFLLISLIGSYGYTDGLQVTSISGPVTTGNGTTKPQNVQSGQTVTTDINNNIVVTLALGAYETFQKSEIAAYTAATNLKTVQNKILAIQNDKKLSPIEQQKQVDAIRKEEAAAIEEVKAAEAAKVAANDMLKKTLDANFYTSELNKAEAANKAKLELLKAKVEAAKIQAEADKKAVADTAPKPLTAQQQQELDAEIKKAIAQAKADAKSVSNFGFTSVGITGSQAAIDAYNKEFKAQFDKLEEPKRKAKAEYEASEKKIADELKSANERLDKAKIAAKEAENNYNNAIDKYEAGKGGADGKALEALAGKANIANLGAVNELYEAKRNLQRKEMASPSSPYPAQPTQFPTIVSKLTTSQADLDAQAANKAAIEKAKKSASDLKNAEIELANTEKSQKNEQKALDEVAAKIKNDTNAIAEAKEILKNEEKKLALENEKLKKLNEDLKTLQDKTAAAEATQKKAAGEKLKADQAWVAIQNNKKPDEKIFTSQKELDAARKADSDAEAKKQNDFLLSPEYKKYEADLAKYNKDLEYNEKMRKRYVETNGGWAFYGKPVTEAIKNEIKELQEWDKTYNPNLAPLTQREKDVIRIDSGQQFGSVGESAYFKYTRKMLPPEKPTLPKTEGTFSSSETKYTLVTDPRVEAEKKLATAKAEAVAITKLTEETQTKVDIQKTVLDAQKATLQKAITFVVAIAAAKKTLTVRNPTPIKDKAIPDGTELVIKVVQKTSNSTNTNSSGGIKFDPIANASPTKNLLNLTSKKQ